MGSLALEVLLGALVVGLAALVARRRLLLCFVVVPVAAAALVSRKQEARPAIPTGPAGEYVTSAACLACHPSEHASFSRTYHRTMTQPANAKTVLAPFERRGDEVWATFPGESVARRIVLTTGSHREQAYWAEGDERDRNDLRLFPSVWIRGKVIPRSDAFVHPPDQPLPKVHWASSCVACHATAGEPHATNVFEPRAVDLGITCEACHGPGARHVAKHRDPVERYLARLPDPTIVNPKRSKHSNEICGQCHAYSYPRDENDWWRQGYAKSFRAGDALEPSRFVLGPASPQIDNAESIFWPDGDVRVGGREYNGLLVSRCKARCVDCHSMHEGDPAGQLAPKSGCDGCHKNENHSHHGGSVGCVDCHMPKTSFALLSAVRSHAIAIPTVTSDKPNACNLCHLDKSRAWTVTWLARWFHRPAPEADDVPFAIASLAGDAGVRALLADALLRAPPSPFAAEVMTALRSDPYAAVRFLANESSLPNSKRDFGVTRDDRAVTIAE